MLPIWWYNKGLFPLRNKYFKVFVLNGINRYWWWYVLYMYVFPEVCTFRDKWIAINSDHSWSICHFTQRWVQPIVCHALNSRITICWNSDVKYTILFQEGVNLDRQISIILPCMQILISYIFLYNFSFRKREGHWSIEASTICKPEDLFTLKVNTSPYR